ncbi:NADH dehydrogenase subunit 1 [Melampsora americana]|nr:NADH dehydrogenase subunit 1 [Melampsora americana]
MLSIISILEGLLLIVPALLSVAFVTIAERKTMASMQRRLGPNAVGYYGLLQAFADALKLLLKEYVAPTQANIILFFLGPMITLIFALLGYLVVPYGSGIFVSDYSLGMIYMLAVSSLATYGILLAGSLRSTAQLISYELILSSVILLVLLLTGNLNMITIVESQRIVDFLLPLFPLFIIFFIGSIAETNRAPFDLAEAESELVSGFMTEHSASIFVFFFLAEYASIVLICILNSILFLGGYLCIIPVNLIIDVLNTLVGIDTSILEEIFVNISSSPLNLAVKTTFLVASFPRIRFDQLMSVSYVVLLPCVVYGLDALPTQILL